jgi:hypothetical protein
MVFLIEHNRKIGRIVTFKTFDDTERRKAEDARVQMELELNRLAIEHEVVLLQAVSEETLRRTHRRYFETLSELVKLPA